VTRQSLFPILTFAICIPAGPALLAQTPFRQSPEEIRARMEQSIARQRASIASMEASLANQQRAIGRQRGVTLAADFFRPTPAERRLQEAPSGCESLPAEFINSLIDIAATTSSVAPELIRGVMEQESAFRPCAVSPKGAAGLMQLEPATAAELGVKNLFDPRDNVLGGARLLRQLLNRYDGDLRLTLSAYNAGMGRVDAAMDVPHIPETMNYVKRILERLPAASPLKEAFEKSRLPPVPVNPLGDQFDLESAPATSLWLMGSDSGK
jgi:soluble lytic murein transglycosylase-like protein